MKHFYNNQLCVLDVETTGLDWRKHDIIQICIIPAGEDLKPLKRSIPFILDMKPRRPENVDSQALRVNKVNYAELLKRSIDCHKGADLFFEWFEKLNLPLNKRLIPLAMNWPFDRDFIIDWLGPKTFELCFYYHYRDIMAMANLKNDIASWRGDQIPFNNLNLTGLATNLGIVRERAHDAIDDCLVTLEVYKRMILQMY